MLTVVTHLPSPALQVCELTFLERQPIDIDKATEEHANYCNMIETCGAQVIKLDGNLSMPDSVFVEDPVIVFDEVAVLCSMGVKSRRREGELLAAFFRPYRQIRRILMPAKLEGGDVLKVGRRIYVGESPRSNRQGITALEKIIEPFGYEVIPVRVAGCLHLKTGCTALDEETILINSDWVDSVPFHGFRKIEIPVTEPFGANVLPINDILCMNEAFPETMARVTALGYTITSTAIAEFMKAEAGLTCMSVPFLPDPF